MFALVSSMLDVVWEAAADAERPDRFRDEDGLDEAAYLAYRSLLNRSTYKIVCAAIEATTPDGPYAEDDYEPLRAAVKRQCDLMWCAAVDAHRSPEYRLADDQLDYVAHRRLQQQVREAGAVAILNARPGSAPST